MSFQQLRILSFSSLKRRYSTDSHVIYDQLISLSKESSFRNLTKFTLREVWADQLFQTKITANGIEKSDWRQYLYEVERKLVNFPIQIIEESEYQEFLDTSRDAIRNNYYSHPKFSELVRNILIRELLKDQNRRVSSISALEETADLSNPADWFRRARLSKRKIIFHGGPTNSGKTYQALQRLREADPKKGGGVYCAPLRLLALEIHEELNRQGVYCDLVTGQEQRVVPFSTHLACTVEILNLDREYDVAVIDEIQMIQDPNRGFAWTRALLGLCANEIHLCGGAEAAALVQELLEGTGDLFDFKTYSRMSELRVSNESLLGDYSKIQSGDCIVAFSKADIFSIKRAIEQSTNHKCCVIYGQLPPETRSNQARLFNSQLNGYDVLVASDAIGMGLNLNIRRIIFHTTLKAGVKSDQPEFLSLTAIKQIGGRAGRLSSAYEYGEVTAWQEQDLAYIKAAMAMQLEPIHQAGIAPLAHQIFRFSEYLGTLSPEVKQPSFGFNKLDGSAEEDISPNVSTTPLVPHTLSSSLEKLLDLSQTSRRFFLCHQDQIRIISNWLDPIPLSFADRYIFATSPVNLRDTFSMEMLYIFAAHFAQHRPVPLTIQIHSSVPQTLVEFSELCHKHNLLDLYLWLSNYFPKCFIEGSKCQELKDISLCLIQTALESTTVQQDYCYSAYYQSLRNKVRHKNGFPVQYSPEVLSYIVDHLSKVPRDKWTIFSESHKSHASVEEKIRSPRARILKPIPPLSTKNLQRFAAPQSKVVRSDDGKLQIYRQLESALVESY